MHTRGEWVCALVVFFGTAACADGGATVADDDGDPREQRDASVPSNLNDGGEPLSDASSGDAGMLADDAGPEWIYDAGPPAESPTGREPRLMWTPTRQGVFDRMRGENHPWWIYIREGADATGTADARWGDFGLWATLAFQFTGDADYAQAAWNEVDDMIQSVPGANEIREHFVDVVWMYDWLYPGLTAEQRADFLEGINGWVDYALAIDTPMWLGGFRLGDSDQVVGQYFGLAFVALATGPENPRAAALLSSMSSDASGGERVAIGGLDATAADLSTVRNTLRDYVERAAGGEWIESSDYNLGTPQLWLMGMEGCRTATGVDHFPEFSALLPEFARQSLYNVVNDRSQAYQWGDVERIRFLSQPAQVTLATMLAGLTQANPDVGPFLHEFAATHLASDDPIARRPNARAFLFYNPYAPRADFRATFAKTRYADGMGLLLMRDSWDPEASVFGGHTPPWTGVDHDITFLGNFQLYRQGEWAITHPLSYGYPGSTGEGTNTMLIAGLSSMGESRGPVAHEFGSDGEYAYLVGETHGQYYEAGYWMPPPAFLDEWTRTILYLPSRDRTSDTILTYDRVDASDPRSGDLSRYRSEDRAAIMNAPALKQWLIHAPVAPSLRGATVSWQTAGGQSVYVETMLPSSPQHRFVDESTIWDGAVIFDEERGYTVSVSPNSTSAWNTFLHVVQVSNPGVSLRNTLVVSNGSEAEGVLLQRAAHDDVLVLFGADPSDRFHDEEFVVEFDTSTSSTVVYVLDLAPARTWSAAIDHASALPLSVSAQGIARFIVPGLGEHSIEFR